MVDRVCVRHRGSYCLLPLANGRWGQGVVQWIVIRSTLGTMLRERVRDCACALTHRLVGSQSRKQVSLCVMLHQASQKWRDLGFKEWVGDKGCGGISLSKVQRGKITDMMEVWGAMERAQQKWSGVWCWRASCDVLRNSPVSSGDTGGLYEEAGMANQIQTLEIKFWGWRGLGLPAGRPVKSHICAVQWSGWRFRIPSLRIWTWGRENYTLTHG